MIERAPYAQMLGVREWIDEAGNAGLVMPASPGLEGREGFLYGGVIGSLLELACLAALSGEEGVVAGRPRPINMTIDFLRGGLMVESYAQARIVRLGKRVVNVDATCWQSDRESPIATGRMHILRSV
ncbi:PaaI family thioesterase [Novosphingobium sp. BL-8H]|uniref:PaaI family thioesterase n=1 Tax=Novosphingobium sp. BL-8H TaxID=3127640 RepID=UPI0037576CAB